MACVVSFPCLFWVFCLYLPTSFFTFIVYSFSTLINLANTVDNSSPPLVTWLRAHEYLSHNSLPRAPSTHLHALNYRLTRFGMPCPAQLYQYIAPGQQHRQQLLGTHLVTHTWAVNVPCLTRSLYYDLLKHNHAWLTAAQTNCFTQTQYICITATIFVWQTITCWNTTGLSLSTGSTQLHRTGSQAT